MNAAELGFGFVQRGFSLTAPDHWAYGMWRFFYFVFAGLVAPALFLIGIVGAPRGTFRSGWAADDAPVRRFRRLFWGNLALATVIFTLFFGGYL